MHSLLDRCRQLSKLLGEEIGEQRVVPEPLRVRPQSTQEEPGALEFQQDLLGIRASRHRLAQRPGEAREDGSLQQEIADSCLLERQHAARQVVREFVGLRGRQIQRAPDFGTGKAQAIERPVRRVAGTPPGYRR